LIPSYNEEQAILERTIIGAQSQDYDNYRIFFWMTGAATGLRELCERRNVGYITRFEHEHAKAGNINKRIAAAFERGSGRIRSHS
jgi:cellulose synthase (UDP-forming)